MEIIKIKEELESVISEKKELEMEIKARNEEIYQMNERLILTEINSSMTMGAGGEQISELQQKVSRMQDSSKKRAQEMQKLKQSLERLRCDLQILVLQKKLNKSGETVGNADEGSAENDKIIEEQIKGTL